ncbi:hypothetical protein [Methanosalsum natronophilum]|uniref:hypothetical protein n=1 Tax=Methanosalsum natronophilum TaxID=768733 RepID=UPI00216A943B|nr:hypothetical protein [Methanosalsum natronophilum]MCS3924560.1 hypothetical protein [Methanosalsum natronophilum]
MGSRVVKMSDSQDQGNGVKCIDENVTEFEPTLVKQVRKSGDIYVGRKHSGKTAYIYFKRTEVNDNLKGDESE